ncbi:M20/M25/M40 family metallo-hydrolase [bacterium]|nr:M20/M25/M40 family metallo-hydrolase [bacterium]
MKIKFGFFISLILAVGLVAAPFSCQAPKEEGEEKAPSDSAWELLQELVLIPGVSTHEEEVVDFIQARLPSETKVQRDEMDNLWFSVGKGSPHLVFVAHTDETGLEVKEITSQGTLKVKGRGGFFPQMYEGYPVVVYTKNGEVEGVMAPRSHYHQRNSSPPSFQWEDMEIDLGVENEHKARALGVGVGDPVTIKKKIVHLQSDLIATRAVDDRAGCAAILAAARRIDGDEIEGKKVTFLWDVQEEIGLYGARHMAQKLDADFVFPVDTFVSSDAPLDNKRFAYLPLGKGAVLRGIDSSNIAPQRWRQKVIEIAEAHHIPLQRGNTRGGNDGSVFVPQGAVDIPLSWPGVYSHTFIEKIHRQDLENLTRLIVALAKDWE